MREELVAVAIFTCKENSNEDDESATLLPESRMIHGMDLCVRNVNGEGNDNEFSE